jgi:hypothetical protein
MNRGRIFYLPFIGILLGEGCTRSEDPRRVVETRGAAAPGPEVRPAAAIEGATKAGTNPPEGAKPADGGRAIVNARSIGNTSVVFKLTFDSGQKAAFKPRSRRGRDRYKGEVAAYRLAQALGIKYVPEVSFERIPRATLEAALSAHALSLELAKNELVSDADGSVPGALIPWIADFDVLRLETEPLRSKWRGWLLEGGAVPDADRPLANQIATMIVFDSVTGNWDRWSGANVGFSKRRQELLFIDNDGAFMVPTPAPFDRQRELSKSLKKYPRQLVVKLRELDEASLRKAVGEEIPGTPLLSDIALKNLDARRKALLDEVDARVRELGEARVFAFE